VADTTTLKPLTRQERIALSPESDRDLLLEARERFALAEESEASEREQHLAAVKFRSGQHWGSNGLSGTGDTTERLEMVIDRLNPMISQTINAYRKSPLSMRVRPKGNGASKKVADLIEGHLRDIEQQSEADQAYCVALDQAVAHGLGYFRLVREYEDPRSFQQVLRIRAVYNRFAVYMDPASVHPAGLDAEFAFLIDRWPTSKFMQWYDVSPQELTLFCGDDGTWRTDAEVQLAEYYYKTYETQELVQLPNGTVLPTKGMQDVDPTWPTRETRIPTVHWVKMAGNAVLERTVWPGTYIPIIRVEGQRLNVNGQDQRTGMVQAGRDAQVSVDVYSTMEATAIMAAPKSPWLLYAEQISGYERFWNQANDPTLPYLLHKAVVVNGQLLPPPQRTVVEPAIQAITQAKVLAQADLQATVGMFEASMGAPSNERSGVAIDKRKVESEGTNYGFTANLAWSIRALGTMCVEILPKLKSGPGELRQVSPDGTVKSTPINQPYQDEQGQTQAHFLSQGAYECVISSGPSYETSRLQVADKLGTVLGAVQPEIQRYFLDTWAASLDFPGSEDLAARLKTLVPPEALAASEQQDPRTQLVTLQNQVKQATDALQAMQQQMEQMKQQTELATQQLALTERTNADMKVRLDNKAQELQLDAHKADIDARLSHEANQLKWHELELKYGLGQPNGTLMPQESYGTGNGQEDIDAD
jgi:hypothetical protein